MVLSKTSNINNLNNTFSPFIVVQATVQEEKKLKVENAKLKESIEEIKKQLLEKDRKAGGCKAQCTFKITTLFLASFIKSLDWQ